MILETIKIAIFSLNRNKLRTLLSMLGIVIGVGAVIAVVSIASGSQQQITGRISQMGSNMININRGYVRRGPGDVSRTADDVFTVELADEIDKYAPDIINVVPSSQTSGLFMRGDTNQQATLVGTDVDYQKIHDYYPEEGRFFSEYDKEEGSNVIVLGQELKNDLFSAGENPLGETISFNYGSRRIPFKIIGVMPYRERGIAGDLNSQAYIPISSYRSRTGEKYVSGYLAQAASSERAAAAVNQTEHFLTEYLGDEDQFDIVSQDEIINTINDVTDTMKLMLMGIAAISLLVGGIGIMNIMLVSVTERTREIGIRKALGAKGRHILGQFLIESLTLSSIGGIIGILLGILGSYGVAQLGGWPFVVSPVAPIIAFAFSMGVGVFFGLYPAYKAAKLDPVESLSYE